jgi:uncharacterized Zn-binding protein involved in type VI secretion
MEAEMKHEGRSVIRIGDKTSHGGQVISASSGTVVMGKLAALEGDMSICPQCKGKFALKPDGAGAKHEGKSYAYHDDLTECGARLISSLSSSGGGAHDGQLHQQATTNATPRESAEEKAIRIDMRRARYRDENSEYLKNKNVQAFLKAVAEAEGGGYDFKFGAVKGRKNDPWRFGDYSTHPGPGKGGVMTAAGMYQITKATWTDHGNQRMGLTDFSPDTQDLIAVSIIRGGAVIDKLIAGDIEAVLLKTSVQWAALPMGRGKPGRYPGQHYVEFEKFVAMYKAAGGAFQ